MKNEVVHMVGRENGAELPTGEVREVRTRCGRAIDKPVVDGVPARYVLVAESGNQFFCTTKELFVSCIKCKNLITVGTIHDKPIRTAVAQKRTVVARGRRSIG